MMEVSMKKFLISAVFLSAAALSDPAVAEPVSSPPSITVQYRDLDLSTPAGHATLLSRVSAAARKVCRTRFDGGAGQMFAGQSCLRATKAAAIEQANVVIARANRAGDGVLAAR
jgi:UrcA family protein